MQTVSFSRNKHDPVNLDIVYRIGSGYPWNKYESICVVNQSGSKHILGVMRYIESGIDIVSQDDILLETMPLIQST